MSEYFRLAFFDPVGDLVGEDHPVQDANGNRIKASKFKLFFDAFDRLVRVERASDGTQVARYRYDALGRRVHKQVFDSGGALADEVFFVSDGAQEIEELNADGTLRADYVWGGQYVDQVVQMRRDTGGGPGFEEYYYHANSMYSVAALTDASGAVVERYSYSSIYGEHEATDSGGAVVGVGQFKNPWRFQGRRFDEETGLYYFRARYLDPAQGRFVSRDPLGLWGDPGNLGNAYTYASGDPVNRVDPFGAWTLGVEVDVGGIFGLGVDIQVGYHIGYSSRHGFTAGPTVTIEGQIGFGASGGAALSGQLTTAQSVDDLGGWSGNLGGSIRGGAGITGDFIVSPGTRDPSSLPWAGVEVGLSLGGGADVHMGCGHTWNPDWLRYGPAPRPPSGPSPLPRDPSLPPRFD